MLMTQLYQLDWSMAIFPIFNGQLSDDPMRNRLKQLLKFYRKMQLFYVIRWDLTLKCGG